MITSISQSRQFINSMCSSKQAKACPAPHHVNPVVDGRPVLQPTSNHRVPCTLERRNNNYSLNTKLSPKSSPHPPPPPLLPPPVTTAHLITNPPPTGTPRTNYYKTSPSPPISPRPPTAAVHVQLLVHKRSGNNNNDDPNNAGLNYSSLIDHKAAAAVSTPPTAPKPASLERSKSKTKFSVGSGTGTTNAATTGALDVVHPLPIDHHYYDNYPSYLLIDSPGSIAAARREQMTLQQAQRKMRIAHYGRSKSAKFVGKVGNFDSSPNTINDNTTGRDQLKRCSFITPTSDPLYVAYHDEEWGVPVHDDKLLFELLVLSGAQVGTDWTSILKKRQDFREAFAGFEAEIVANFTERQMTSITTDYSIDLTRVRGVVDNANRILEVRRHFGSFDTYIWGFVNHKPIATQYKSCLKIPVKTSKSESISKDMVKRGFRSVGPTVVHSFMEAAGLTNDHLITCPRHLQCTALAASKPLTVTPVAL